ncbi:hypothetical protein BS50DRAFT_633436 [Corynespora cassiicola Philippines]|uniref:Uncharacterized protein n=1 Tax=Corynespora cassiicola Philippines TaxID=1448308 RepID=A0A2T2NQN2_CORCC|nr:hypothetical protein BS50DRAFT_633436 [Corynespora cassiicola Philippines]
MNSLDKMKNITVRAPGQYTRMDLKDKSAGDLQYIIDNWKRNQDYFSAYVAKFGHKPSGSGITRRTQRVELIMGEKSLAEIKAMKDEPKPEPKRKRISRSLHKKASQVFKSEESADPMISTLILSLPEDFIATRQGVLFESTESHFRQIRRPHHEVMVDPSLKGDVSVTVIDQTESVLVSYFPLNIWCEFLQRVNEGFINIIHKRAVKTGERSGSEFMIKLNISDKAKDNVMVVFLRLSTSYEVVLQGGFSDFGHQSPDFQQAAIALGLGGYLAQMELPSDFPLQDENFDAQNHLSGEGDDTFAADFDYVMRTADENLPTNFFYDRGSSKLTANLQCDDLAFDNSDFAWFHDTLDRE